MIHHRITATKKHNFSHIEDLSKMTSIPLECFYNKILQKKKYE